MPRYFEFEVSMVDVRPRIWRRFLLRSTATFADLHEAIQSACGWWNCHLYLFRQIGTEYMYGQVGQADKEPAIAGISREEDMDIYGRQIPDAEEQRISRFFGPKKAQVCDYEYDFGDSWLHLVRWVGQRDEEGCFRRRLLGGQRAFPHENCGGLDGYERCVEFVRTGEDTWEGDPEGLRKWLGGWHPDRFDFELTKKYFDANWHVPIAGEPWIPNDKELEQLAKGKLPKAAQFV